MAVTLSGRGLREQIMADRDGVAEFRRLPVDGRCSVRAESPGFEVTVVRSIACSLACETVIYVPMRVDMRKAETITTLAPPYPPHAMSGRITMRDAADEVRDGTNAAALAVDLSVRQALTSTGMTRREKINEVRTRVGEASKPKV